MRGTEDGGGDGRGRTAVRRPAWTPWNEAEWDAAGAEVASLLGRPVGDAIVGDGLEALAEESYAGPPSNVRKILLRGVCGEMTLGSADRPLYMDELRWLAEVEREVVGADPSGGANERWRLRRNALKRRRLGMPAPMFDHDRMMDVFGWCDPATAFIDDRGMLGRAGRLMDAAARCAVREGAAVASLLSCDPRSMEIGPGRDMVWECLADWMDGRGRIPSNPMCRLAAAPTGYGLAGKWDELPRIGPGPGLRREAVMDDVAWIMAVTRMDRLLGGASMPVIGSRLTCKGYDPEAIARGMAGCGDMLYDTGLPETFLRETLLAVIG